MMVNTSQEYYVCSARDHRDYRLDIDAKNVFGVESQQQLDDIAVLGATLGGFHND
jgi:hypothetical protein